MAKSKTANFDNNSNIQNSNTVSERSSRSTYILAGPFEYIQTSVFAQNHKLVSAISLLTYIVESATSKQFLNIFENLKNSNLDLISCLMSPEISSTKVQHPYTSPYPQKIRNSVDLNQNSKENHLSLLYTTDFRKK